MGGFRFLHAADLHLDSPFRGMSELPGAVRDILKESTFSSLKRLVQTAISEKVDFVVISGDIYDLSDRSLRAQIRFQRAMEQLAERGIRVFAIHGNHDPENGARAELSWPDTVRFFPSDRVEEIPAVGADGRLLARVYGISYGTAAVTDNLALRFQPNRDASVYRIGLLHTNVDGDAAHDNYAPCAKEELLRSGIDYWALGHVHHRRVLHSEPYIVYPGNLQGRSVRETGAKGCYVVDVADTGKVALTFHALDSVRWFQEDVSIQGMDSVQELKDGIEQRMEQVRAQADGRPAMARIRLQGKGRLHSLLEQAAPVQELLTELHEAAAGDAERGDVPFVWIESLKVHTGAEHDWRELMGQESFIGDLLRISQSLLEDPRLFDDFCDQALSPLRSHSAIARQLEALLPEEREEWLHQARELAVDALAGEGGGER